MIGRNITPRVLLSPRSASVFSRRPSFNILAQRSRAVLEQIPQNVIRLARLRHPCFSISFSIGKLAGLDCSHNLSHEIEPTVSVSERDCFGIWSLKEFAVNDGQTSILDASPVENVCAGLAASSWNNLVGVPSHALPSRSREAKSVICHNVAGNVPMSDA